MKFVIDTGILEVSRDMIEMLLENELDSPIEVTQIPGNLDLSKHNIQKYLDEEVDIKRDILLIQSRKMFK